MINREVTIRWKGYDPDDLKPQSSKRVWANCDSCGYGRWVYRFAYSDLCMKCSREFKHRFPNNGFITEYERYIKDTKIDRIITVRKMGYDPINLGSKSGKKVWAICNGCNVGRLVRRSDHARLCRKCGEILLGCTLKEKYKLSKPKYVVERKDRFILGTGIDRIETIRIVGYDPIILSHGSVRKVWSVCYDCGDGRLVRYQDYRDLCASCKQKGERSPLWKGGLSLGKYCYKFNARFKEQIRDLFGRRCFLCGVTEEEIGRRLDVHHVNYDKDCICNSSCEFVPLCRSCHVKTNSRRQYWEDLIMCYLYPDRITMVDL